MSENLIYKGIDKIISDLENDLQYYDRILFFDTTELLSAFCQSEAACETSRKLLVLFSGQILPQLKNITFRQISEEEAGLLKKLYFMYQFSDKFLVVSKESTNYASLFHFVDTGVLSTEEAFEALLH